MAKHFNPANVQFAKTEISNKGGSNAVSYAFLARRAVRAQRRLRRSL